jgi:hypothetical protein
VYGSELGLLLGGFFLEPSHFFFGRFEAPAQDDVLAVHRLDGGLHACVGRPFQKR